MERLAFSKVVCRGDLRILAMNSQYLGAALLAIAVGIAVGFSSIKAGDEYCPSPSPASVTSLFAPCQTFVAAVGHPVSKQEAVQMGLLTPDLQPAPATQFAHNLRSVAAAAVGDRDRDRDRERDRDRDGGACEAWAKGNRVIPITREL